MKNNIESLANNTFESIKQTDEYGNEFWYARALAKILDYADYRNFRLVIEKAKKACQTSNNSILDHFVDINDMIQIGKGGQREIDNIMLSRYACYLIVQNADATKPIIANGQTYFAIQTINRELQEQDKSITTRAANLFCATQTEDKLKRENIYTKDEANHIDDIVAKRVRETIQELGGMMPENLLVGGDIHKIEQKVNSQQNKLAKLPVTSLAYKNNQEEAND